jgi:signal transduction histidine kinase
MGTDYSDVVFATKIARHSLKIIVGFFLLVLAIVTLSQLFTQKLQSSNYERLAKAEAIAGEILLADERLTNAATNYASSASSNWYRIYNENIPIIDSAIAEATKLASAEAAELFRKETSAANTELVEMEGKSFQLANAGNRDQATRLINSTEYNRLKRKLAEGTDRFLAQIRLQLNDSVRENNSLGWLMLGTLLCVGAGVFAYIWRRMNESLRKSEVAFLAAETQIRDELTTANVNLLRQSKLSALGQLTATIAHELRNPLGSVRTSAFLMERKLGDRKTEFAAQLERIQGGIIRCDNIITQLLDYSRSTPASKVDTDFDGWIEKTITEQAETLSPKIEIQCEFGVEGQKIGMDVERMRRVITNLISNACEAMVGKGDQLFTSDGASPVLKIQTSLTARGVEVSVTDNGPGIPKDVLAKIFDPLFTTKSFGTGLGLPAVQKIMEMHHGGLEVDSVVGTGTTFKFWLPSAAPAASEVSIAA